jgi:DNA polymerase elongation subunit (family B)
MEYGAMANANFIFYDSRNAEAITSTGQVAIKFIERKFNEYFHKLLGTDTDVVLAVDTDSVVGETIIRVDNEKMRIEDFWDSVEEKIEITESGGMVKKVNGVKTLTFENDELVSKNINYVYTHEVEKEMFEIEIDGNCVIVTGDHSLIVYRSSEGIIPIKAHELCCDDELIYIK